MMKSRLRRESVKGLEGENREMGGCGMVVRV